MTTEFRRTRPNHSTPSEHHTLCIVNHSSNCVSCTVIAAACPMGAMSVAGSLTSTPSKGCGQQNQSHATDSILAAFSVLRGYNNRYVPSDEWPSSVPFGSKSVWHAKWIRRITRSHSHNHTATQTHAHTIAKAAPE